MDLVKFNNQIVEVSAKNIPLYAIPQERLNYIMYDLFVVWLSNLLSLSDDVSAERLEFALPKIVDECRRMSFGEIIKMFELYADGKLDIKPIPNYFDRIRFGEIREAYRRFKRVSPSSNTNTPMSEEDKVEIIKSGLERVYRLFLKDEYQIGAGDVWVYEYLVENELLVPSDSDKRRAYQKARKFYEVQMKLKPRDMKKYIQEELDKKVSPMIVRQAKIFVLVECLKNLTIECKNKGMSLDETIEELKSWVN